MPTSSHKSRRALELLQATTDAAGFIKQLAQESVFHDAPQPPVTTGNDLKNILARRDLLESVTGEKAKALFTDPDIQNRKLLNGSIENFIGFTSVPTGIAGPLRVKGTYAFGDFYVPLATTEGALVASYHRGAKAGYMAGGITSVCLIEGVQRSPVFKFAHLGEVGTFLIWLFEQVDQFKKITKQHSNYAILDDMKTNVEGNHLTLTFEYHTGDAAGQNMVTFCTDEICAYIIQHTPIMPRKWYVESNFSGDKKATALSFSNVRGKKVTAEVCLSPTIVKEVLKSDVDAMVAYWQTSTIGAVQSGSIGAQGHFANGLTALFLATGQDVACIAEAAVGITRMEKTNDGQLYASVTLPNLIIGTVGGGTAFATQKDCLKLLQCEGKGGAKKFAEIAGALVLAGELSIAAAISAGHFSSAHKSLGRKNEKNASH